MISPQHKLNPSKSVISHLLEHIKQPNLVRCSQVEHKPADLPKLAQLQSKTWIRGIPKI